LPGLANVSEQALYIQDLFDFFATESRLENRPHALPAPRPIRDGFEFRRVSFAYPGRPQPVLNEVSSRLEARPEDCADRRRRRRQNHHRQAARPPVQTRPGRAGFCSTALTCGTTTPPLFAAKSASSFRTMSASICWLGKTLASAWWTTSLTPSASAAAEKSLADGVIAGLPLGYEQMLGRRFSGSDLSAGQWQKIALGRAYLRDAQLVILDEPTASLDARAEFAVFERFAELTRDKMAVLIGHQGLPRVPHGETRPAGAGRRPEFSTQGAARPNWFALAVATLHLFSLAGPPGCRSCRSRRLPAAGKSRSL
jgi:ATP-binding cassette subfamily B protein